MRERTRRWLGWLPRRLARAGAQRGVQRTPVVDEQPTRYRENPPASPRKLDEYFADAGEHAEIEAPEALALNKAVARFIGPARSIVGVGSISAAFERFVAVDRRLEIVANVRDESFAEWARARSPFANLSFYPGEISKLLEEFDRFDLALAIGVIDERPDYAEFLRDLSQLADRAVVTAVNKARSLESLVAAQPIDRGRVREWTAGELYWVLKSHFDSVELFAMPDPVVPLTVRIGLLSERSPVIAVCERT